MFGCPSKAQELVRGCLQPEPEMPPAALRVAPESRFLFQPPAPNLAREMPRHSASRRPSKLGLAHVLLLYSETEGFWGSFPGGGGCLSPTKAFSLELERYHLSYGRGRQEPSRKLAFCW